MRLPKGGWFGQNVIQTFKQDLRSYEVLRGNHHDWDLMLSWIAMRHKLIGFVQSLPIVVWKKNYVAKNCSRKIESSSRLG